SPGISAARAVARLDSKCADDGAHGHGYRARSRGRRPAAPAARAGLLRRELQPAQPHLPRRGEGPTLRTNALVRSRAPEREWNRLLPEPQDGRECRRKADRRWREGRAVSRWHG